MSAGDLAARFSHAWPTTTRHLKTLTDAGLLVVRKSGRERLYTLDRSRLATVVGLWLGSLDLKVL
jgi:DNA-binding transcriptional ArsR family regulator